MTLSELRQWVIDQTEDEPEVRTAFDSMVRRLDDAEGLLVDAKQYTGPGLTDEIDAYFSAHAASSGSGKSPP